MCYTTTMFESLLLNPDLASCGRKRSRFQAECFPEPSTKRRRVVKAVRFSSSATQYEATTGLDTWYTSKDLASFRDNIKRDVKHISDLCKQKKIEELDRQEYSPIGLEKYCCSSSSQHYMKFLRSQCIRAVLDQQLIQRQMGISLPEPLREVSQTFSTPCVTKAASRAEKLFRRRL